MLSGINLENATSCDFCDRTHIKKDEKWSQCDLCRKVNYCSFKCKKEHWTMHQLFCSDFFKNRKVIKFSADRTNPNQHVPVPSPCKKTTKITMKRPAQRSGFSPSGHSRFLDQR